MGSKMAMLADFDTTVSTRQKYVLLYIAFGMLIINVLAFYLIHDIFLFLCINKSVLHITQ